MKEEFAPRRVRHEIKEGFIGFFREVKICVSSGGGTTKSNLRNAPRKLTRNGLPLINVMTASSQLALSTWARLFKRDFATTFTAIKCSLLFESRYEAKVTLP